MLYSKLVTASLLFFAISCSADIDTAKTQISSAIDNEDFARAYVLALEHAENGDAEMQHAVALLISNGYGELDGQDSDASTLYWLRLSADQGFGDSLLWLSDAFSNGWFGLSIDREASECWRSKVENNELECKSPQVNQPD